MGADKWYIAYINWAVEKGVVSGMSDTEFWPDGAVTREQFATMISNCITNGVLNASGEKTEQAAFADLSDIADYAKEAVALVQSYGIINGMGDNMFMPKEAATRAQAAKILSYFVK